VLLAVVVCAFFAGLALYVEQELESDLMEARLRSLARWQQAREPGSPLDGLPPGSAYLVGAAVPANLRTLPDGFHEIELENSDLQVLVGTTPQGERFAAINDSTAFERIERDAAVAIGIGLLASALLAAVLGTLAAGQIIRPLARLAETARSDSLQSSPELLERRDEVGELARAFAARTEELERFLLRERLFTGDVSHELRTPLSVVLGAADVVAARLGERPELRGAVERIRRTAAEMADRVGALLILSRAPQALKTPPIALADIVKCEADRYRFLLTGRPVTLVVDRNDAGWVEAPPELAAMAIGNLIRNACQYTENGQIVVRIGRDRVLVEDSGPGLPDRVRAQLFERFVRNDAAAATGAGLGLALVKRICDHLGWDVWAEDLPAGGTCFTVSFTDSFSPQPSGEANAAQPERITS
jgi:signal transduction histidine kinase